MRKGLPWVVLVSLCSTVGYTSSSDTTGLRLVVKTDRASYAPSEPVVVTYWVENNSEKVMSVPPYIESSLGWIRFEFAGQDSKFQPYRTGVQATGVWTA